MRTDGQTDMTKLIVTFRNFVKAPKIYFGKFAIERSIRRVQANSEALKLNCTYQLLVYIDSRSFEMVEQCK